MFPKAEKRAVEYGASLFPKAEKQAIEYGASLFPKVEKRAVEEDARLSWGPEAEKREIDHTRHSVFTREQVDESELACCLTSDSRCQALLGSQVAKRAVAERELVDESDLACCLLSDARCQALLE